MKWGLRPTAVILGKDNRKRWSKWDIVLSEAFQILESERCGQCGLPKYICQNSSNDIAFQIEEETCNAMVAQKKYEEKQEAKRKRGKKGEDPGPPPGVAAYPVPYTLSGAPLETFREPFYIEMAKRQEQIIESRPKLPG